MKFTVIAILATILALAGCEMPDDERCKDRFEWSESERACVAPVDTDAPVEVDTSPVQEGLGVECWAQDECSMYAPDGPTFCLLDPTDSSIEGMCSFTDCTYADCGGDYQCCDCTDSVVFPGVFGDDHETIFCADAGTAGILSGITCVCE